MNEETTTVINETLKIGQWIEDHNLGTKSRRRPLVYRRAYLYAYMNRVLNYTLSATGEFFGKDHASVKHGIENVYDLFKDDPYFVKCVDKELKEFPMNKVVKQGDEPIYVNYHATLTENAMTKLRQYKVIHRLEDLDQALEQLIQRSR